MESSKLVAGLILAAVGIAFILFRNKLARGSAEFYRKMYSEKNLKVIFPIMGTILILGCIILILAE